MYPQYASLEKAYRTGNWGTTPGKQNSQEDEPQGHVGKAPPREEWEPKLRRWYDTLQKLGDIGVFDVGVFYVFSEDFIENPQGVTKALESWIKRGVFYSGDI